MKKFKIKIKNKNKKASVRAFTFTLAVCFLTAGFVYGLVTAYINTQNSMTNENVQVVELQRSSFDNADLFVLGKKYNIKLQQDKKDVSPIIYVLIPPQIRLLFGSFDATSKQLQIP